MLHIHQTTPGRWLAATAPGRLVVVESANPTAEFIGGVWAALTDGTDGQRVLDHITSAGILAAPAFALITWDVSAAPVLGKVRVIVRGAAEVSVETTAGQRRLSADGVSTWLEQLIDGVTGFRVELEDAAPSSSDVALPLETGAAWVSAVHAGVSTAPQAVETPVAAAPAAAEPAPAEPTPHEPEPEAAEPEPAVASEETIADETIAGPSALSNAAAAETSGYIDATQIRPAGEPASADLGDHDGMTVMSSDIHAMRSEKTDSAKIDPTKIPAPNADAALPGPQQFVLKIDGGPTEPLNDLVLIGRAPSVSKVSGGRIPRLITVGSADQDISRNHVQLAVEGGTVVVTDLHSRNGTMIVLPGRPPQKLRQGEPTSVIVGTVVDLGGGVKITVGVQ